MSDQDIRSAVEATWRRATFHFGAQVAPWDFFLIFRAELSPELAEHWAEEHEDLL